MKVLQQLKANELNKNLFLLISGNGLAQIIPLIFYPLITRLYSPENFGTIAVLMSVHSILLPISTGRYEHAIILPKKKEDALYLFNIGLSLTIIVCFLIPIITLLLRILFPNISVVEQSFIWYLFLGVPVFMSATAQLVQGWSTRFKLFKIIVEYILITNILSVGIRLLLGFFHVKSGLFYSFFISQVLAGIFFLLQINKKQPLGKFKPFSKASIQTAKVYQNFPKHNLPNSLINNLSSNLPIFILASFFSNNLTGQFSVAIGLLFKPILIYTSSASQVLSQNIVEIKHQNKPVWPIIKKFLMPTFSYR